LRGSRRAEVRVAAPDELGKATLDGSAVHEDVTSARLAAQTDVRAEPIDEPAVAAARMGASEPDHVAEIQHEGWADDHPAEGIKVPDDRGRG
jgi:hypothetical protein